MFGGAVKASLFPKYNSSVTPGKEGGTSISRYEGSVYDITRNIGACVQWSRKRMRRPIVNIRIHSGVVEDVTFIMTVRTGR